MSVHWPPDPTIVQLRPARRDSGPALAVALLIAAAVSGVGAGAVLSSIEAPSAVATAAPVAAEIMIPEVQADSADTEWAGRAVEGTSARASTSSARTGGVALQFGYCHSGGGTNCVVDGDTFYIGGAKVRIAGIDAPETHPPRCSREAQLGDQATQKLQALLNSGAVTMTGIGRDRDTYGRLLRNVAVDGQDVGDALVDEGLARWYQGGRKSWC